MAHGAPGAGAEWRAVPPQDRPDPAGVFQNPLVGTEEEDWFIGDEAQSRREELHMQRPISRATVTSWDNMEKVAAAPVGEGPARGAPAAWRPGRGPPAPGPSASPVPVDTAARTHPGRLAQRPGAESSPPLITFVTSDPEALQTPTLPSGAHGRQTARTEAPALVQSQGPLWSCRRQAARCAEEAALRWGQPRPRLTVPPAPTPRSGITPSTRCSASPRSSTPS